MGLDPQYKPLYEQAKSLQFRVHDALDNRNHPSAVVLRNEMQKLLDDMEVRRSPRNIEDRIKIIQHTLLEARSNPNSYMDIEHADQFHQHYENMREHVRRFNDYS